MSFNFLPLHDAQFEAAEKGRIDLLLIADDGTAPAHFASEVIFEVDLVCVVAKGSPFKRALTLKQYLAADHIGINIVGGIQTIPEKRLSAIGAKRHCPMVVPFHTTAMRSLIGTNLVATVPRSIARSGNTFPSPTLTGIRWAFLAAFFGLTAAGLFSYLRNSRSVAQAELYTAVNIYLLLGLPWAAIYLAIDAFSPGSIRIGSDPSDRQTELLYFSLITLSTVGYGDIVPLSGMARILTALEGVTGVLYIATTVAFLVGRFRNESWE